MGAIVTHVCHENTTTPSKQGTVSVERTRRDDRLSVHSAEQSSNGEADGRVEPLLDPIVRDAWFNVMLKEAGHFMTRTHELTAEREPEILHMLNISSMEEVSTCYVVRRQTEGIKQFFSAMLKAAHEGKRATMEHMAFHCGMRHSAYNYIIKPVHLDVFTLAMTDAMTECFGDELSVEQLGAFHKFVVQLNKMMRQGFKEGVDIQNLLLCQIRMTTLTSIDVTSDNGDDEDKAVAAKKQPKTLIMDQITRY